MMNSTDKAYERDMLLMDFLDCACPRGDLNTSTIDDYNNALEDYYMLLDCAKTSSEKAELRREIQHCKAEKRKLKRLIENHNRMENCLTT